MLAPRRQILSGYNQKMRKLKFFKLVGIIFEKKNKFLKYEKSENHTFETSFESSFLVKKWQTYILQKNRACARGDNFFSSYNKLMRRREFFRLIRITIETKVSEVRKKSEKLTFEGSVWVK